jgi:galactose mutarotase-like enzyme
VGFNEACFVTGTYADFPLEGGQILSLRHEMFDNDAIVLDSMTRQVTLECDGDDHAVTVTFPQMGYLGLWHWPRTDAPYICIEPWCSLPSFADQIAVFEEQKDLIRLPAGQTYRNTWTIEIS